MTLAMNREVFITAAITGSGDTTGKSDKVPVTPEQIANAAIDAAKAGAAVVHCHVRNPKRAPHRAIPSCSARSPTASVNPKPTWF